MYQRNKLHFIKILLNSTLIQIYVILINGRKIQQKQRIFLTNILYEYSLQIFFTSISYEYSLKIRIKEFFSKPIIFLLK